MISIVNTRKIWFTFSGIAVGLSLFLFVFWGLNLGIDFRGGSLLEVEFVKNIPSREELKNSLADLKLDSLDIQKSGNNGYLIRFKDTKESVHQKILQYLKQKFALNNNTEEQNNRKNEKENAKVNKDNKKNTQPLVQLKTEGSNNSSAKIDVSGLKIEGVESGKEVAVKNKDNDKGSVINENVVEKRFEAIGPVIGQELKRSSIYAIITVLIAIVLFIAYAFRKVSYPIESWKYGVIAIIALFHDILITIGVFVILGFYGVEVNMPFVAALLTILGYSVNDTIVVFDRIRENLPRLRGSFAEIIDTSIKETFIRSINTSLTTLVVLLAIYFFGGSSIRYFVLSLIIGIAVGTYSSIFLASPLLYIWQQWRRRR